MFLGPWPDGVVYYRNLKLATPFGQCLRFCRKASVLNTAFNDIRVRIGKNLLLSGTKIYSNSIEFLTANLATGKVLLSTHFAPSSVASFLASSRVFQLLKLACDLQGMGAELSSIITSFSKHQLNNNPGYYRKLPELNNRKQKLLLRGKRFKNAITTA